MKNRKQISGTAGTIFLILCSLFITTSCSDFLDRELQGSPTTGNYYQTTYQLQEALNGVFNILQSNNYNNCEWIFGEACGDDVIGNDESGTNQIAQLVNFTFNTSNTWIRDRYAVNYKGISAANQVIANINRVKFADDDIGKYVAVREILGQAKFLRALFYFNLVKTYGGVPVRPETEDINQLVIPRSSKEEVYACIEKDLREAAVALRHPVNTEAGKPGTGAAVALLMKVLGYEAQPGEPSEYWDEIVRLGEYFIEGKDLSYREILHFDERYDCSWDELRESLWFKPKAKLTATDPYEDADTKLPVMVNNYNLEAKSLYDGSPLHYRELYNESGEFCARSVFEVVFKESANGMSDDLNQGTGIFDDLLFNRLWASSSFREAIANDPRKNVITTEHGTVTFDGERLEVPPGRFGCMKWYTPKMEDPASATTIFSNTLTNDGGKNRRVIIYSEVVLWYAEALNETGNGMKALEQINRIKTVANKITGASTLYQPNTYVEMRNQIWTERRVELCHLWDRFFDLVRQGRAAKVLHDLAPLHTPHLRGKYFVEGVNEIFPIPQNEIDITNGVVSQNPGY
ncbi:MAG: RagB/SusD family nutrient uptake outer membrane protein [Dysgonamonadaceae bacterium]|jgi:hypothetical protein|nr:RagB/SusD family nutrient uptake outer membrane protein [Dysgonamonadaceae bacterium]